MNTWPVREIPKLGIKKDGLCEPCQLGKQLQMSHKVLQQITTTRILKLLHMDLMGPMQVESTVGKRYIFVCVYDFFRFTWVDFLKEKLTHSMFLKNCA